jgi:serine/threonine protein kinase
VVQIFDVVESREFLVLVMEYVPGIDLECLLEQVNFDLPATLLLACALCTSLSVAHREGIIHRDLKPANILLDHDGRVKLGDFGIARGGVETQTAGNTRAGIVAGSFHAMSPEQASGAAMDQRSDLFSLGLIIYRLLAGRHPFAEVGNDLMLLQQLHQARPPELAACDGVPSALLELVGELLEKEPEKRPSAAVEVRRRLMGIIRSLPVIRGNSLGRLIQGRGRETDALGTPVELPEGVDNRLRSHVVPFHQWAQWQLSREKLRALAKMLLVLLPTGLLVGMTARQWSEPPPDYVTVRRPMLLGLQAHSRMRSESLHAMLREAVGSRDQLSMHPPPADQGLHAQPLVMQVQCNPYICGLQLTRGSGESISTDFRSLPPDASADAWRASIERGVDLLYPLP